MGGGGAFRKFLWPAPNGSPYLKIALSHVGHLPFIARRRRPKCRFPKVDGKFLSKRSGIPSTQQQKAARSHLRERKPWAEFSYHWLFTLLCCSKMRSNASRREQQAAVHHPWPAPWRPPCRGAKKTDHATGAASIATPMPIGDSGWM